MIKSNRSITSDPYSGKTSIDSKQLTTLESLGREQELSSTGYVRLSEKHLSRESTALLKNAIVFTKEMKKEEIQIPPSMRANREVYCTYYELGRIANVLSDEPRSRGYNAHPLSPVSSNLNLTVAAHDAGLGGFGKHGLIITPQFGPSIRIAAILTDIEDLPFYEGTDHDWISSFCDSCNACVRACLSCPCYLR